MASLILDGERPFGRRASNRTITIPVKIVAPPGSPNTLELLAAAREVLAQAVDQDIFTITWTRDPGAGGTPLPLILDCFRAQPSKPFYAPLDEDAGVMRVNLTIPALPYGRSDVQLQVPFAAPVPAAPPPPPPPVVIDTFSAISSVKHFQSTQCVVGPRSCGWDPDDFRNNDPGGRNSTFLYSASLATTLNISGMTSLAMWLGFGSRYHWCLEYRGKIHGVSVNITLVDTSGRKLSFSRNNLRLPVSPNSQQPTFSRVSMPIPGDATFDYTSVGSYTIEVVNRNDRVRRLSWVTCYVDALTAYPPSQTVNPVTRGSLYTLYGLVGTARTPASLAFQQAPAAGTVYPVTTIGVGTYTVPALTAWLKVEAIGGGGAGASLTGTGNGGGGGGGGYSRENVFPCSPGDVIPYIVGAGGTAGATPADGQPTVFGPGPAGQLVVTANGGGSTPQNSSAGDPGGAVSANVISYPGGTGRTASGSVGGGGASSGGTSSAGLTPTGTAATTFTSPTTSTWTCPAGVTQVYAECWGSGASGATGNSGNGGGGGGAEYAAGYVNVTPFGVYSYTVAAGGTAVTGVGQAGHDGASSTFAGDAGLVITAHGGLHGTFQSRSGGQGGKGTGSSNAVHFDGGTGGSAFPYAGSGGSSAGPGSSGNNGSGYSNSTPAPAGGGAGGAGTGANGGANGTAGSAPGGGGGGCWGPTTSGAGAAGQVRINYPSGLGAPTSNGAAAVAGGGAGGAGGPSANTAGSAGSQPGGGGGGGCSTGTAEAGGAGGAGKLIITPYTAPAWKNLIVHRPPLGSPKTFQPLIPIGAGGDVPDGTHQYSVPQPLSGINADFAGTYTIYAVASSLNGSASRTVTVTCTQYEYAGGPSYTQSTLPVSFTPSQIVNGILVAGVMTLPIRQVAADNSGGYYSFTITDSNTADRWLDLIALDTQGQTICVNRSASGYLNYYIDEAEPNLNLGLIMGSSVGRPGAISVYADCPAISGTGIYLEPAEGENQLFAYSADAQAPAIGLTYSPRWFFDRFQ